MIFIKEDIHWNIDGIKFAHVNTGGLVETVAVDDEWIEDEEIVDAIDGVVIGIVLPLVVGDMEAEVVEGIFSCIIVESIVGIVEVVIGGKIEVDGESIALIVLRIVVVVVGDIDGVIMDGLLDGVNGNGVISMVLL